MLGQQYSGYFLYHLTPKAVLNTGKNATQDSMRVQVPRSRLKDSQHVHLWQAQTALKGISSEDAESWAASRSTTGRVHQQD